MNKEKRVVCLYRVSTKQQVTEDDIPMQRNACMDFISTHTDWEFVNEYSEKGVSGFKIKAENREVLEQLKADATKNKFDVVLVFMFDRLGRIEEETPYVLKWFIDHGIEIWSVKEGQRVLDNHIDTLLNYITFWQAEGESKKIQQRTLEAKKQMVEAGKFLGCAPAYGYKHSSTGKYNAKGREIKRLEINEMEAKIIEKIFNLSTIKGYGSRRIAKELNEIGIISKRGKQWSGATITGILKNTIYKGYFTYGRNTISFGGKKYTNQSECLVSDVKYNELVIIQEAQWIETQNLISARAGKVKSNVPKQTRSPLLFTGFAFCKNCGAKLTLHYSYSHTPGKQGVVSKKRKSFYVCYGSDNGHNNCTSRYYSAERIEGSVMDEIYEYLDRLEKVDLSGEIINMQKVHFKKFNKGVRDKKEEIREMNKNLSLFKSEIINVIKGKGKFSVELLNEQIKELAQTLSIANSELKELEIKLDQSQLELDKLKILGVAIPVWRDELKSADNSTKKMLLAKIIERVEVGDGEINVELNIKFEEFLNSMNAQCERPRPL